MNMLDRAARIAESLSGYGPIPRSEGATENDVTGGRHAAIACCPRCRRRWFRRRPGRAAMNADGPLSFGWRRAAELGLGFRRITDDDLAFLARVHASSRVDE